MMGGLAKITGRRALRRGLVAWVAAAGALVIVAPSVLAGTESFTFEFNGTETWTVPEGVSQVTVTAVGGGGGGIGSHDGGNGAAVEVEVSVAPGETFTQVASGAGINAAPGATFSVGVGGGGTSRGTNNGGAGGGGASIVRGPGSDLSTISLLIIAGGGGGAGRLAAGGDGGAGNTAAGGDGGGANAGKGGADGIGGASGNPYANALNFVLDSPTSTGTGRGHGGADVGGAGSLGGQAGNLGGGGGAGFGGGGIGSFPSRSSEISSSGGAGGSTAQGSTVIGTATYSPFAGSGGTPTTNGLAGWVRITWASPLPPPAPRGPDISRGDDRQAASNTRQRSSPVTLAIATPSDMTCTPRTQTERGAWLRLPAANECSISAGERSQNERVLLGWSTSPDFSSDLAREHVANATSALELYDEGGRITAVFIPAGGWAHVTADVTLFPIWG